MSPGLLGLVLACAGPAPTDAPSPTPELDPEPAPSPDPAEVPAEWRCAIELVAVEADERFRGHPDSPARSDALAASGPDARELDIAESHSASYRSCTYRLRALGRHWRWTETWDTTFADLHEGWCIAAWESVSAQIQRTTRGCTEPDAGAFYGYRLEPLD